MPKLFKDRAAGQTASPDTRFRIGKYVTIVPIPEGAIVAHGPKLWRIVLDADLSQFLQLFPETGITKATFQELSKEARESADDIFEYFKRQNIIVEVDFDEAQSLAKELYGNPDQLVEVDLTSANYYSTLATVSRADVPNQNQRQVDKIAVPIRFLLIGGCVMQFLRDHLQLTGLKSGFDVTSFHRWPLGSEEVEKAVVEHQPDVIVFQTGTGFFLSPLWDHMTFISAEERRSRLEQMKMWITIQIQALRQVAKGRLILVHNLASLQVSPFGRGGFRLELGFREILAELNLHIERKIKDHLNFMLVDEDLVASRIGLSNVFDDAHFNFGHHGGQFDPQNEVPNQYPLISELFSAEYFSCYQVWKGIGKIKCIICDLDGTLWPGIAEEDGFGWISSDASSKHIYAGIHQALQVLKSRGILLATCSKNTESSILEQWSKATSGSSESSLLRPDEFAVHKISWNRKSQSILEMADVLGIGLDSMLFIDDNPVEREEVRRNVPMVHVYDGKIFDLRAHLLTNPALETSTWSTEANSRTEMVQSQILREQFRHSAVTEDDFLKSLKIQMRITKLNVGTDLDRVIELIQRTNQFNTTLRRYDAEKIHQMMSESVSIYTFSAADRFTNYGQVGVVIIDRGCVDLLVMSCRVLALKVAVPFLVSVCRDLGIESKQPKGKIVEGPRNEPCRGLFSQAGFTEIAPGEFVLKDKANLTQVDPVIYQIEFDRNS